MGFLHIFQSQDLQELIRWGGFAVIAAIVFSETGLLAGFFLPGDSLLFTAGMLVGMGVLKPPGVLPQEQQAGIVLLNVLLMAAAFAGNSSGSWIGEKGRPPP